MTRVAITGMGVISAISRNLGEFEENLFSGTGGIRQEKFGGLINRTMPLARVDDSYVRACDTEGDFYRLDRVSQIALIASQEALSASGHLEDPERLASSWVVIGTSLGGATSLEEGYKRYYRDNKKPIPSSVPKIMPNAPSATISMRCAITGPSYSVTTACSSSAYAIAQGFDAIRSGATELAIVGGADSQLSEVIICAWEQLRVTASDTCRPFCKSRTGMVLGEGAAVLVLESESSAHRRKAEILGFVAGYGASSDAKALVKPNATGQTSAMRQALRSTGVTGAQIDFINAHGTGTQVNDVTECVSLKECFGEGTVPYVTSSKSLHGHTIAASGAVEAVASILSIRAQKISPTINFVDDDPHCDLQIVKNENKPAPLNYAMSNSFAFGGQNCVVIFERA